MRPSIHCELVNGPFGDPAVYADIMFERRALLFDLGDITELPPRKLLRVTHVFVSHTHMDHFSGFDHLLRLMLGREKTIALYGPAGFIDKVGHKLQAYTWNVIKNYAGNLVFDVYEVHDNGTLRNARFRSSCAFQSEVEPDLRIKDNQLTSCGAFKVRCAVLDHGIPCLGFALEEAAHVNVWKTKLDQLGLAVGPWLRDLKHAVLTGAPMDTPIRALKRNEGGITPVTLPFRDLSGLVHITAGQKIAYIVDVRYHPSNAERIRHLAFGADLLFIESPFLEADSAHAARKNHLTARQAGTLAARAQVKQFVLCHFSPRYPDHGEALREEARRAFSEVLENEPIADG
jgi:ribonuclease Z